MGTEGEPATEVVPQGSGPRGATSDGGVRVPFWLERLAALGWRSLVVLAAALVVLFVAFWVGTSTAAVILALVVASTLAPLLGRLEQRGWGASKAAGAGTLLAFGIVVAVLAVGGYVLVVEGPKLVAAIGSGLAELERQAAAGRVPAEIAAAIRDVVGRLVEWLKGNLGALVGSVAGLVSILLFGAFTTFYLLADARKARAWLVGSMDQQRREATLEVAQAAAGGAGGYFRTVTVSAVVKAVVSLGVLLVFGVPLPVVLTTFVFAASFVPYVGSIVSIGAVFLVALSSIGPGASVAVIALLVVVALVQPRIVDRIMAGQSVHLNPGIVLIGVAVGAAAAGLFGVVMSVPVAAALFAVGTSLQRLIGPASADAAAAPPDAAATPPLVPAWLDSLAQWSWRLLIGVALVAVAVLAILQVPLLLMPFVLAAVLGASFGPLAGRLAARGIRRGTATGIVVAGVSAGIVLLMGISIASILVSAGEVFSTAGIGAGDVNDAAQGLAGMLGGLVGDVGTAVVDIVLQVSASLFGVVVALLLGIVLTFFVIRDGPRAWVALAGHLVPWQRQPATRAASDAVAVVGGYMVGTGIVSFFGAATQWLLMVLLGVPLALPVFVLSFFGGYIPYFGSAITTGMAFLLTVTTGNVPAILIMLIFTMVFNVVQGSILQPLVFSRAVSIHPAIILLGIPAGGAIAGVPGMFLVVPVLGVIGTTWRTLLVVLGQPPAPEMVAAGAVTETPASPVSPEPDPSS